MFDKFKQAQKLLQLRQQAKKLQDELSQVTHSEDDGEFHVKVDGTQSVVTILQNGEELTKLVKLLNKAMKEMQKKSAQKMMEMGGGLSGLLGNLGQ